MIKLGDKRKIDGKTFILYDKNIMNKHKADNVARDLRKKGYNVRVIRTKRLLFGGIWYDWLIYRRPK